MDWSVLRQYEKDGLINIMPHPAMNLFILNYTNDAKIKNHWDEITKNCRGLIIDEVGNIKYQCLPKFFNLGEHDPNDIPHHLNYEVQEKYDGSYGVLYFDESTNDYAIATRGSFTSNQAFRATEILHRKYRKYIKSFDTYNYTFIFEIIYPENQIVVDYGDEEKLVLIAVIHNDSGNELSLKNIPIPFPDKVEIYENLNFQDFQQLREKYDTNNREGFVIKFKNGFRIKAKFDTYFRLHRIISNLSKRAIWEILSEDDDSTISDKINKINEIQNDVPKNYAEFINSVTLELINKFWEIETKTILQYDNCPVLNGTRKDFALWAKEKEYPNLLFCLYDNKKINQLIWEEIKP